MATMWAVMLLIIAIVYVVSVNYFLSQPIMAIQQLGTQLFLLFIYAIAAIAMSLQIYSKPSGGDEGLAEGVAMIIIAAAMVTIVPIIAFSTSAITRLLASETRKNKKRKTNNQGNIIVLPKEIEETPDRTYRYQGRIFSSKDEAIEFYNDKNRKGTA